MVLATLNVINPSSQPQKDCRIPTVACTPPSVTYLSTLHRPFYSIITNNITNFINFWDYKCIFFYIYPNTPLSSFKLLICYVIFKMVHGWHPLRFKRYPLPNKNVTSHSVNFMSPFVLFSKIKACIGHIKCRNSWN